MAASDRDRLTQAHRDAQRTVAAWVAARMAAAWPTLDPARLDATTGPWVTLATGIVRTGRALSAALAAAWHQADRSTALDLPDRDDRVNAFGAACLALADRTRREMPPTAAAYARRATGPAPTTNVPTLDPDRLRTSLVVTGPVTVKRTQDPAKAKRASTAAATRHTLAAGRDTITHAVHTDDHAVGWLRVPAPTGCAFCLMLAARGPTYKTARTAKSKGTGTDPYHDGCDCQARAVYSRHEPWPDINRRAADLWTETAKGLPAKYARNAFRTQAHKLYSS